MATRSEIYRKEQERKEITQHAKKIDQGFRRLNEIDEQRAIWELFQNAIDLSDGNCEITIQLTEETIIFSHNSKVFTPSDLSSLNKQYSLKTIEDNEEEVGQYGTGFLSTHSFGKSLEITSSLDFNNEYTDLVKFPLNRNYDSLIELEESIITQENLIQDILDSSDYYETPRIVITSLEYSAKEEKEKKAAKESLLQIQRLVPYVFTFCNKLSSVIIKSYDQDDIIYSRVKSDDTNSSILKHSTIKMNEDEIVINYLQKTNEDGKIRFKIIIPQDKQNKFIKLDTKIPRLFLFYPLIGSHDFGFNFIIHSKDFSVNEKRSTLELSSDNPKLANEEKKNNDLLDEISDEIFKFLSDNITIYDELINISTINFKRQTDNVFLNNYNTRLQSKWVSNFKELELVVTEVGNKKPSEIYFLSPELFENNENISVVFKLIKSLEWDRPIPINEELAIKWTEIVNEWNSDDIKFIDIELIISKIEGKSLRDFSKENLLVFYKFLIENGHISKIENKRLFPNLNGDLCVQAKLLKCVNIDKVLIENIKRIRPQLLSDLVDNDFILTLAYKEYNRQRLYQDFKDEFESYFQGGGIADSKLREEKILNLTLLCNLTSISGAKNHRVDLVGLITEKYSFEITEEILQNIEDDKFDFDSTPLSSLIRLVANDMMFKTNLANGIIDNSHSDFIKKLVAKVNDIGQHKSLLENLSIFPNQLGKLCKPIEVAKESDFFNDNDENEEFKNLYYTVSKTDIRKNLVDPFFSNGFEAIGQEIKASVLSSSIENEFLKEKLDEINDHSFKKQIFDIIEKMTEDGSYWTKLFPNIETKKEIIMMSKMTNKETKNDLFKIIGLENSKISVLGELSRHPNMERIIALGKAALQQEFEDSADFDFKKKMGVHIENLIRAKIGHDIESLTVIVEERQNGQDFIIKINEFIVYYIEVKSRWNKDNPIRMSKNQISKAIDNKEIYSLCCVEMADYKVGQEDRYKVKDIAEILDRIKFINSIGQNLEPLMKDIVIANDIENEITIDGDYKATIPRKLIKTGSSIDDFVNHLIVKLNIK